MSVAAQLPAFRFPPPHSRARRARGYCWVTPSSKIPAAAGETGSMFVTFTSWPSLWLLWSLMWLPCPRCRRRLWRRPAVPVPRRTHHSLGRDCNGERRLWGWRRAQFAQGRVERSNPTPRSETHCVQSRTAQREMPQWVGARRSPPRVSFRGCRYLGNNEGSEGTQFGHQPSHRRPARRNPRCNIKRPASDREAETGA